MMSQFKNVVSSITKRHKGLVEGYLNDDIKKLATQSLYVIGGTYFAAMIVASLMVPMIMRPIVGKQVARSSEVATAKLPPLDRPNFRNIRKAVIERNVFNLAGEYPDESAPEEPRAEEVPDFFDDSKPCSPTKLKLALLGTIFFGDERSSMATIQEKGVDTVDVYRAGDFLYGHEEVQVYEVHRNKVILNNEGRRECLEIKGAVASFVEKKSGKGSALEGGGGPVVLESAWVESQLGEGFSKVISTVRLVPHTGENGSIVGFRIFKIQKGTLMDKAGFKDGDVVTKVNDTPLNEQAFVLYDAFLNEKEVNVELLRQGKNPTTLNVQIK